MITPRKDFRESQYAKGWQNFCDSRQFNSAVQTALAEMDLQNKAPADMASAASYAWRKAGAMQFLAILMNLTATDAKPKHPGTDNLRHDLQ
jgi:uncharacterized lipoprotein NlpE involved in copper resistance